MLRSIGEAEGALLLLRLRRLKQRQSLLLLLRLRRLKQRRCLLLLRRLKQRRLLRLGLLRKGCGEERGTERRSRRRAECGGGGRGAEGRRGRLAAEHSGRSGGGTLDSEIWGFLSARQFVYGASVGGF